MDYANGGDLCNKIKNQKKKGKYFSENQILDYFTQICLAIKHIHDRKILHRDIKSQNIFLMKNNRVKLGDFGIAKCLNGTFDKAKTLIGTPYYLSPEIINDKPYDYKSDIWSLGILLYEMCALKMPFEGNNMPQLYMKISNGNYSPLSKVFSQDLRNLVNSMLNVNSFKRPSIGEILRSKIISPRIKNFLNENEFKNEFSHTILHSYNLLKSNNSDENFKDKERLSDGIIGNKKVINRNNYQNNFQNKNKEREKNILDELNLLKKDLAGPSKNIINNYNNFNSNGNNVNYQFPRNVSDKNVKNNNNKNLIQNSERIKKFQRKEFSDKDNKENLSKNNPIEVLSKNGYISNNNNILNQKYSDRNNNMNNEKEQKSNLQDLMKQMRKKLKNEQEKEQGVIWMKGMENFINLLNKDNNVTYNSNNENNSINNNNNNNNINNVIIINNNKQVEDENLIFENLKKKNENLKDNNNILSNNKYNNIFNEHINEIEDNKKVNLNYSPTFNLNDETNSIEKINNLLYDELINELGKDVLLDLTSLLKKFVNDNILDFDYDEINKNIKKYYEQKEVNTFIIDKAISKIPDIYYLILEDKIK